MGQERVAWVVGDVHGCLAELRALEAVVRQRADKEGHTPVFVLLGDLVDRGPSSKQVVDHAIEGGRAGTHVSLAGNHEEFFLRALNNNRPDLLKAAGCQVPFWLETLPAMFVRQPQLASLANASDWAVFHRLFWITQGGAETLNSYGSEPTEPENWDIPLEHVKFLCELPLVWRDDVTVVTHALAAGEDIRAVLGGVPLTRPQIMRILWSRTVPSSPPDPNRIHVSGHTPLQRLRRSHEGQVVRVDTGACMGGRLTGYCPKLDLTLSVGSNFNWRP